MANGIKRFGVWLVKDCIYLCVKFGNELWSTRRNEGDGAIDMYHLVNIGWYEKPGKPTKLFSLILLFVSIQVGVNPPKLREKLGEWLWRRIITMAVEV